MGKFFFFLVFFLIFLPGGCFIVKSFEGKKPNIIVELPSRYLNKSYEMSLSVSDVGKGLKNVRVSILKQNKETILLSKRYPNPGIMGLGIFNDSFKIPVKFEDQNISDGEALIIIHVSDYSFRAWNKGNWSYREEKVIIDSVPPKVEVLTKKHNIKRGGAGLVIYRLFEKDIKSGVMIEENFFPGFSGMFSDIDVYTAFIGLDHSQGQGSKLAVVAIDSAGNKTSKGFRYYIGNRKFKTDTLNIPQSFLDKKIPGFNLQPDSDDSGSKDFQNSYLKKFIYINSKIREKNSTTILSKSLETKNKLMWRGKFLRLPGSARRASFGDRRIYKYKGKEIGRAVHLGVDLASVKKSRVSAANAGIVIAVENIGIYGNSVIIDHGFGLCTLYSHLSSFSVEKGDEVKKGDAIGRTGITGLAGGDHLHFGVFVNNVFVNPVEWWDKTWIDNNIMSEIDRIRKQLE
ncbi:MAG: M23 family metallopeptidase [Desulfobacteraceae bacterium]|nr:M23 family metallopeptidase [Desulfobacteraceae bacterium]